MAERWAVASCVGVTVSEPGQEGEGLRESKRESKSWRACMCVCERGRACACRLMAEQCAVASCAGVKVSEPGQEGEG
eukprot:582106-Rhodomonas_salina.1